MIPELTRAPPTFGTTAFKDSEAQISGQDSFPKHDADLSPSSTKGAPSTNSSSVPHQSHGFGKGPSPALLLIQQHLQWIQT